MSILIRQPAISSLISNHFRNLALAAQHFIFYGWLRVERIDFGSSKSVDLIVFVVVFVSCTVCFLSSCLTLHRLRDSLYLFVIATRGPFFTDVTNFTYILRLAF